MNNNTNKKLKLKKDLNEKYTNVISKYTSFVDKKNSIYIHHILSSIHLEFLKACPDIEMNISYRKKSRRSLDGTIKKELNNENKTASDIAKDSIGACVTLNKISDNISFDKNNPKHKNLIRYVEDRKANKQLLNDLKEWLDDDDIFNIKDEDSYYINLINILKSLDKAQYDECANEIEFPYKERLQNAINIYKQKNDDENLSMVATKEQLDEIKSLTGCLNRRLDDKLANEILAVYLPEVLNSSLIKDTLKVDSKFDKLTAKSNGWYATYHNLSANGLFPIELQAQSKVRSDVAKYGTAFHNAIPGKQLFIKSLFEPSIENDPDFSKIMTYLSTQPVSSLTDENANTRLIISLMDRVKVKDTFVSESTISNSSKPKTILPIEDYLIYFLNYTNCNFHETSVDKNDSSKIKIEHKTSLDSISDVLRKRDGLSCLDQILMHKLNLTIQDPQVREKYIKKFPAIFQKNKFSTLTYLDIQSFVPPYTSSDNSHINTDINNVLSEEDLQEPKLLFGMEDIEL